MLAIEISEGRHITIEHVVLDVNGTLAVDGILLPRVVEQLALVRQQLAVHLLTADTYGTQEEIDVQLGLEAVRTRPGQRAAPQKEAYVHNLGADRVVAIGNGANDRLMFRAAALAIAILGPEGMSRAALLEADILVPNIHAALDLLLHPRRVLATLRG